MAQNVPLLGHLLRDYRRLGMAIGIMVYGSLLSLLQDCIGKSAYTSLMERYWLPSGISVPLALACLAFCGVLWYKSSLKATTLDHKATICRR